MSRTLLLRMLENLFRRWWIYLLPVLVLGVIGVGLTARTEKSYRSTGTFNVEASTVLSSLSGGQNQIATPDTPATTTSDRINSLLQTDQFIKGVATAARLKGALQNGELTIAKIRSSVSASANGANLVNVVAASPFPAVAQALARATIDSYVQSVIDTDASQSQAAVAFYTDLAATYRGNLDKARQALDAYTAANPAPIVGSRPDDQTVAIGRLTAAVKQAQDDYDGAVDHLQNAQLSTDQTKADVGQRLRLVDAPRVPVAAQGGLRKAAMSAFMYVVLGFVFALLALVVVSALDRTIRSSDDVVRRLGTDWLATVPDVRSALTFATPPPAAGARPVGAVLKGEVTSNRVPSTSGQPLLRRGVAAPALLTSEVAPGGARARRDQSVGERSGQRSQPRATEQTGTARRAQKEAPAARPASRARRVPRTPGGTSQKDATSTARPAPRTKAKRQAGDAWP